MTISGLMAMKHTLNLTHHGAFRRLSLVAVALFTVALSGCEAPDENSGTVINQLALPTDVVLKLACEDVGVSPENCVLADPENPFVSITIEEFNENDPSAPFNKFELAAALPLGSVGAKSRFYFWATALARRAIGENQYFTALALHELFDANSNDFDQDELIRAQALKAYRSVLDNFFDSVVVFTATFGNETFAFPTPLKLLVADILHTTRGIGSRRLIEGDPNRAIQQLLEWGYVYSPVADDPATTDVDESLQGTIERIQ